MDKLKRAELFSDICDDEVSEEDALQALRAALNMYVSETDELMSQTDVKDAKGMLSGRIKHIREDLFNIDNLQSLNITQLLKSQRQLQRNIQDTAPLTPTLTYSPAILQNPTDQSFRQSHSHLADPKFVESFNPLLTETVSSPRDFIKKKMTPKIFSLQFDGETRNIFSQQQSPRKDLSELVERKETEDT